MGLKYDPTTDQWVAEDDAGQPAAYYASGNPEDGTMSGQYTASGNPDPPSPEPTPSTSAGAEGNTLHIGQDESYQFFNDYGTGAMQQLYDQRQQYQDALNGVGTGAIQTGQQGQADLQQIGNHAADAAAQNAHLLYDQGQQYGAGIYDLGQQYAGGLQSAGQGALDYGMGQAGALGQTAYNLSDRGAGIAQRADSAQIRNISGAQQDALMRLESQAGPSGAQAQLAQATNANQANALAMARSGRGFGGSASAMRQAAAQRVGAQQQSANQSAMLLAQEEAARRQRMAANYGASGQLAQGAAATNDQREAALYGLGLQGMNAGASAQQAAAGIGQNAYAQNINAAGNAANVGLSSATQGGNFGMQGTQAAAGLVQQGIEQQGQLFGQGAQTALAGQQLGGSLYGQAGNYAMQNLAQQGQIEQAGLNYAQQHDVDALNATAIAAGVQQQQQQQNNQMIGAGLSAAGTAVAMLPLLAMSDRNEKEGIKPANVEVDATGASGGEAMAGNGANLVIPQEGTAQPVEPAYDPFSQGVGISGPNQAQGLSSAQAAQSAAAAPPMAPVAPGKVASTAEGKANPYAMAGKTLSGGLGNIASNFSGGMGAQPIRMPIAGSAIQPIQLSDKREKESLRAVDAAPGYSYNYKDPDAMGATNGRQFGVMAQDLEKTPAGRSVVRDVRGKKMVDTSRLTLVNTAAMNALSKRIAKLEARS